METRLKFLCPAFHTVIMRSWVQSCDLFAVGQSLLGLTDLTSDLRSYAFLGNIGDQTLKSRALTQKSRTRDFGPGNLPGVGLIKD